MQLLTSKDQLLQEAERGQVFDGYCEGTLTFKPTYKYDVGSSNYDTSHKVCTSNNVLNKKKYIYIYSGFASDFT